MSSINTNISALVAQKSMSDQVAKSEQAIERLSSGLRINNAADDAAGSAISSKMESQVRSLGVAIRNGHDAISMTQTAEGALGEIENILQRVRELSVQAGNSTLSSSDRTMIQSEVDALTSEIDKIAGSSNFNGVKLLDGTVDKLNFQIGINDTDSLAVNLQKSDSLALGLKGSTGVSTFSSERVPATDFSSNTIAASDIKINGQNAFAAVFNGNLSSATANEAKLIADAINANTAVHGAKANAFNTLTSSNVGDFVMTTSFTLDVDGTAHTIAIASSYQGVVDNINETVSGLKAHLNADNTITLSNKTGAQFNISNSQGATDLGFTANSTYNGFVSLENIDGSAVKIEAGSVKNGYTGGVGTIADVQSLGFNENSSGKNIETDVVSGTALAANELKINDVIIDSSATGSAASIATAINAKTTDHGVTASAKTEVDVVINTSNLPNTFSNEFSINKSIVDLTGATDLSDITTAINAAAIGDIRATATSSGTLLLTSESGQDIRVANGSDTDFISGYRDINGTVSVSGVTSGALDADGIATVQAGTSLSAGDTVTLNGVSASSNSLNGLVTLLSSGNDAGITFTVTGTDVFGNVKSEDVTGANAGTATTTGVFGSVTSVAVSGALAANISVGVNTTETSDDDGLMTVASGTGYSGSTTMTGAQKDSTFNGLVTILSAGNDSGISVTITGTDLNGTLQTQTVTMANAGTATSTKTFGTVTDLSFSGNAAGNVTVGTITRADVFTVRGNLDLSNTTGGVVKVDTVADDTAANLASGATAETVLQKLGIQGQGQSFEVTGTKVAVTSLAGANASLSLIDNAIDKVALFRSSFGAVENRIDASINNLTTLKVNTEAARSRIEDADFAAETTNLTKSQILSQAATSMLAQANSSKQNLLALLQG